MSSNPAEPPITQSEVDEVETLVHNAIRASIDWCRAEGRRRFVGLLDKPEGTFVASVPESDAKNMLNFAPGWLITAEGEIVPVLAESEESLPN